MYNVTNFGMSGYDKTKRYRDCHLKTLRNPGCVLKKKNLVFIGGAMGVGKTTVSRELQRLLPA